MEVSLTRATKVHAVPKLLDKLNAAFGAPSVQPHHGQGSSFLALPVKRNVQPADQGAAMAGAGGSDMVAARSAVESAAAPVDFKVVLSEFLAAIPAIGGDEFHWKDTQSATTDMFEGMDQRWYHLNQLRVHAGAPERTEQGVQKLMAYYAQLCWLEDHVPFATGKVRVVFSWSEAFFPKKSVPTSCVQYEKAAVMWNIGAIYSQMGAMQSLWTPEGLKRASKYFQKANGAFSHIRDHLFPRFVVKLDASSDLCDFSVAAAGELMLAQAAECFYQKAEYDNTSSPVTSQIAAQAADFYDLAYKSSKQANSFGKYRFPKTWSSHMHVKHLIYTAIAHLHSPNYLSNDMVVGERHSRLLFAKEIAESAVDKCVLKEQSASPELRVLAASVCDKIQRVLDSVDKANYETFHQTVVGRELLTPLRRPPHSLVHGIDVVRGVGCGSVWDGIRQGKIRFVLESQQQQQGTVEGVNECRRASSVATPMPMSLAHVERLAGGADYGFSDNQASSSVQSLQLADMERIRESGERRKSVSTAAPIYNELCKFAADSKHVLGHWINELTAYQAQLLRIEEECEMQTCVAPMPTSVASQSSVKQRAEKLLDLYRECESQDAKQSSLEMFDRLVQMSDTVTAQLQQLANVIDTPGEVLLKKLTDRGASMAEATAAVNRIAALKPLIVRMRQDWFADVGDETSNDVKVPVNDAAIDDLRELRAKSIELMTTMEEEAFGELFGYASTTPATDLHWSAGKIRTVLPCFNDHWRSERSTITAELSQLLEPFNKTYAAKIPSDHALVGSFNAVVSELARFPLSLRAHSQDVEKALGELQNEYEQWCVALSHDKQGVSEDGKRMIERLASIGKLELQKNAKGAGYSGVAQTMDTMSHEDFVRLGIEVVRGNLQRCVLASSNVASVFAPTFQLFEQQGAVARVQDRVATLAHKIQQLHQSDAESEKIVATFEEQLDKWTAWRNDCVRIAARLEPAPGWIQQKFGAVLDKNATAVTMSTASRVYRKSSSKDLFASTEELNNMINEGEHLEKQQARNADKIAHRVLQDMQQLPMPSAPQMAQQHETMAKRSPKAMRKQMLRQLSVTAAAIEKQAREIDGLNSQQLGKSSSSEELRAQQMELARQLKALQEQQRGFFKMHRASIQEVQGEAKATATTTKPAEATSRKISGALREAKDRFMNVMRRASAVKKTEPEIHAGIEIGAPAHHVVFAATNGRPSMASVFSDKFPRVPNTEPNTTFYPSAPTLRVDDLLRENQNLRDQLKRRQKAVKTPVAVEHWQPATKRKVKTVSRRVSVNRKPAVQEFSTTPIAKPPTPYRTSMYDDDDEEDAAVPTGKGGLGAYLDLKQREQQQQRHAAPMKTHRPSAVYVKATEVAQRRASEHAPQQQIHRQSVVARRVSSPARPRADLNDAALGRPATTTTTITIATNGPADQVQIVDGRRTSMGGNVGHDFIVAPVQHHRKSAMAKQHHDLDAEVRATTARRQSGKHVVASGMVGASPEPQHIAASLMHAQRKSIDHGSIPRGNLRDRMESVSKYLAWNRGFEGMDAQQEAGRVVAADKEGADFWASYQRRHGSLGVEPYIP